MNLTLNDHGIDDVAAIVHGHKAPDLHFSRAFVDVNHADVSAERKSEIRRIVIIHGFEPRFEAIGNISVRGKRDFLDGLGFTRRALYEELAGLPFQIRFATL